MEGIANFMGNGGIYIAMFLFFVAIGVTVLFSLYHTVTNFEESKKALLGIAGLVVIMLIGFALAGGEMPEYAVEKGLTAGQFRMIGALLNTAIIATVLVSVYIVVDVFISIVRN